MKPDAPLHRPEHANLGQVPYFVTTRTHHSRTVFVGRAAEAAVAELQTVRARHGFLLMAYAFMPDHAHFVIVPATDYTISQTMRAVKGAIARRVNIELGTNGTLWQDGLRDDVAFTARELNTYIEYVHANPVAAGMVEDAGAYAFSSGGGACMADYQRYFEEARD